MHLVFDMSFCCVIKSCLPEGSFFQRQVCTHCFLLNLCWPVCAHTALQTSTCLLCSSSCCSLTCSCRTITWRFHSAMGRPASSWVGTRESMSARITSTIGTSSSNSSSSSFCVTFDSVRSMWVSQLNRVWSQIWQNITDNHINLTVLMLFMYSCNTAVFLSFCWLYKLVAPCLCLCWRLASSPSVQ